MERIKLKSKAVLLLEDSNEYLSFLLSQTTTLFYHSPKFHQLLKEHLQCELVYFLVYVDEKIAGSLPMMYKSTEIGTVFNSIPYYGSNGSFLVDKSLDENIQKEVKLILYKEFEKYTKDYNIISTTIITNPLNNDKEFIENELNLIPTDYRIGQITHLPENINFIEELMMHFHKKTRNVIRKSIKNNVNVCIDNTKMNYLYDIHKENMETIGGKAKDCEFFQLVEKYFVKGLDYNIYIATYEDKIISSVLLFYFNKTVEYFTPVVVKEYRSLNSLSQIIASAMLDSIKSNYINWNWGGTWESQKGVYEFKKEWGTSDYKYYYYNTRYSQIPINEHIKNQFKGFYLWKY